MASYSKSGCLLLLLSISASALAGYTCKEDVKPKRRPASPPPKCPPSEDVMPDHRTEESSEDTCYSYTDVKPKIKDQQVTFQEDVLGITPKCRTAWDRVSKDKRLTIFAALLQRFDYVDILSSMNTVATVIAPTDAAIMKIVGGRFGYTKDDFMNLNPSILHSIVDNHIILGQEVMSIDCEHDVLTHLETVYTNNNMLSMQAYTGKWKYLCFATSNNYTEACAPPGNDDLTCCKAVAHVVNGLLLPGPLPPLEKKGCVSVYNYIAARHDMQDLKAAIDAAKLQALFNGTRTAGTYFLFTDKTVQTLLTLNGHPYKRLADMDVDFVTEFLQIHVIPNVSIFATHLVSGYTYETALPNYYILADVNHQSKVIQMWNEVTNSTIVEANLAKCSAVVHVLNQPLAPVTYRPVNGAPVLTTYGPFDSVADVLATSPVLSGMYDLIGASALAEVASNCVVFGTWFLPSNQALCRMAARGLSTQLLFTNKQRLLNFLNSQVIPFSTLPFKSLSNGVQLPTAFQPVSISIAKFRSISNGPLQAGNVEVNMYNAIDGTNTLVQVNFNAMDLHSGKAIVNIVEDALLSSQVLAPAHR